MPMPMSQNLQRMNPSDQQSAAQMQMIMQMLGGGQAMGAGGGSPLAAMMQPQVQAGMPQPSPNGMQTMVPNPLLQQEGMMSGANAQIMQKLVRDNYIQPMVPGKAKPAQPARPKAPTGTGGTFQDRYTGSGR